MRRVKLSPRQYQLDGIRAIRQAYKNGFRSPLYVLPTGGGKTFVYCYIADKMAAAGKRILILTHRQEILSQTVNNIRENGCDCGVIAPGHAMTGDKIQVASVYTAARRLDKIIKPHLIVIDEAHHATAKTWAKIIDTFAGSYKLGVTATPVRLDGKGLGIGFGGCFDTLVNGPSISELINNGYLTPAITYAPPTPLDMHGIKIIAGDFDKKETESRVNKPVITGCAIEHYKKLCFEQPCIVFCQTIKHAEDVAKQFNDVGIPAQSIDGSLSDDQRKYRINCLASGKIHVLTSCEIISEGTDIPVVSCVILLRPTASMALYRQQCGRGLRPAPQIGKTHLTILDHVGNCRLHGLVEDDITWSLEGAATKKKKDGETPVKIRECKSCYFVYPIYLTACPRCGAAYLTIGRKIEQVEGELVKVSDDAVALVKKMQSLEVKNASTYDDFLNIAKRRGYNPKWALIRYKLRMARSKYA
jgi:DNA repair protein RadD